jgi:hypothetical protein
MRQRAKQQRVGRRVARAIGCALLGLALLLAGQAGAQEGDPVAGGTLFNATPCEAGGGAGCPKPGCSDTSCHPTAAASELRGASLNHLKGHRYYSLRSSSKSAYEH